MSHSWEWNLAQGCPNGSVHFASGVQMVWEEPGHDPGLPHPSQPDLTPACIQTPVLQSWTSQTSSLSIPDLDRPLPLALTWVSAEGTDWGKRNQGRLWVGRKVMKFREGGKEMGEARGAISEPPGQGRVWRTGSTKPPQGRWCCSEHLAITWHLWACVAYRSRAIWNISVEYGLSS